MNKTEQNNILIAEFLGMQKTDLGWFDNEEVFLNIEKDNTFDTLKFNIDWNWLMEVVSEIENRCIECRVDFYKNGCSIDFHTEFEGNENWASINTEADSKIEAVHEACVEFVKWHNENLTSQN